MTQITAQKIINHAQKLLDLEALVLANEREWYQAQLKAILARLEAFNEEIRSQYGIRIAEIMQLNTIPHDMKELARIISTIKYQLQQEAKFIHQQKLQTQAVNRYSFFAA